MSDRSTAHPDLAKGNIKINQQHNAPEPDESAKVSPADQAGEDDGSTSVEGKDGHLHEDQKPLST